MGKRIPPLSRLSAFEAAVRLGGFSQAAKELNLTPGAISYQVKMLEAQLGVHLFHRRPSGLELTDDGRRLSSSVLKVFDALEDALDLQRPRLSETTITVTVAVSFAIKWLLPRMETFRECHPEIRLEIVAEDHLVDFAAGDRDVGIRYGSGDWPGVETRLIHDEILFPVCSPLLRKKYGIRTLKDLLALPLVKEDGINAFADGPDWEAWLRRAKRMLPGPVALDSARYSVRCQQAVLALEAAIEGQGITLARGLLAADDLANGRLVRPLDLTLRGDFSYYLVHRPVKHLEPAIQIFHGWIRDACRRTMGFGSPAGARMPAQVRRPMRRNMDESAVARMENVSSSPVKNADRADWRG